MTEITTTGYRDQNDILIGFNEEKSESYRSVKMLPGTSGPLQRPKGASSFIANNPMAIKRIEVSPAIVKTTKTELKALSLVDSGLTRKTKIHNGSATTLTPENSNKLKQATAAAGNTGAYVAKKYFHFISFRLSNENAKTE